MRSLKSSGGLTRGRGFEKNVRHLWVKSINYTAAVHEAMTSLSGIKVKTSEQHADMGLKRRKKDFEDCQKFFNWFESRNPFNMEDSNLHSLSTGVVSVLGEDIVNCDIAEDVGLLIQNSLDNINLKEATIKKKDQFKSLDTLTRSVKVGDKNPI